MYRKRFVYTASAMFIPLILTPQKCWKWGIVLRWPCAHQHRSWSSGNGFPPHYCAAHKLTIPVPCFESTWMKPYRFCTWTGKAVMYCTIWVFWFSCSLICRRLYHTVLHRADVSLKKKYRERCSEFWKHEGVRPDNKAGSYTITSNKYNFVFFNRGLKNFWNPFQIIMTSLYFQPVTGYSDTVEYY